MIELPDELNLIVSLALLALVPFIAMMATSFVKLAVVFSLLRNALGVQQIPPNMAMYGLPTKCKTLVENSSKISSAKSKESSNLWQRKIVVENQGRSSLQEKTPLRSNT